MIQSPLVSRFSKALFAIDKESKIDMEKRLEDFEFINGLRKNNPELDAFIMAPQVSMGEKEALLDQLCKDKFDSRFFDFIKYLLKKRKFNYLSWIAENYRVRVNEFLGIWEATVITAIPLNEETKEKLKHKVESTYKKKIKLNSQIDPKIVGGALLIVGNQMMNWTVTDRLKKLKESLVK